MPLGRPGWGGSRRVALGQPRSRRLRACEAMNVPVHGGGRAAGAGLINATSALNDGRMLKTYLDW